MYVVCTAVEFVWNEGGVVPATCYLRLISLCVIFLILFHYLLGIASSLVILLADSLAMYLTGSASFGTEM
jgi:hypothetical protein